MPHRPRHVAALSVFAVTGAIYVATMNRTIGFMDRGELAGAAATWGIPHSTGYPTLMLLAGAVVHMVPFRPVIVLNVLAALLTALGAAILVLLFDEWVARTDAETPAVTRAAMAGLAALGVALTTTWWQQANGFEVYALHCVLMPLVVLAGLRWMDAAARPSPVTSGAARRAIVFGLVVGLSFTNHMTTMLLAPGLIAAALMRVGVRRLVQALPRLALGFGIGLLPYAWLPIRSAMHPAQDWGSPHTWNGFVRLVTADSYRRWMFANVHDVAAQARFVAWEVPADFAWVGLLFAGLGAAWLARRDRAACVLALTTVVSGGVFAVGYRIPDLESYLLTAVLGIGLLVVAGYARLARQYGPRVAWACGLALAVVLGVAHVRDCDERDMRLAERYFRDLVEPLPANAVVFTTIWGQAASPALYFQGVERVRPDVVLVELNLLGGTWYLDALARRHPDLVAPAAAEFDEYRALMSDAEYGHTHELREFETLRRRFVNAVANGAAATRPVFSTVPGVPDAPAGSAWAPLHLARYLAPDSSYVPEPEYAYRGVPGYGRVDADVALTLRSYAESRVRRAEYERAHGREAQVEPLLRAARTFDPRIDARAVTPMPLRADDAVLQAARYFNALRVDRVAPDGGRGVRVAARGGDGVRDVEGALPAGK